MNIMSSVALYSDYGSGNMLYTYQLGNYADYGSRNVLIIDGQSMTFQYYE